MDSIMPSYQDKPYVQLATAADAMFVAQNMRIADLKELQAMHGDDVDVVSLLLRSWKASTLCYAIIHQGVPVGIFGVLSLTDKWGAPWLIGTPGLPRIARDFLKGCPRYIEALLNEFPNLINYVHRDNVAAIRWLKSLGFTLMPTSGAFIPFIQLKRYS